MVANGFDGWLLTKVATRSSKPSLEAVNILRFGNNSCSSIKLGASDARVPVSGIVMAVRGKSIGGRRALLQLDRGESLIGFGRLIDRQPL